jgi:glycosyltransferase involved in cell wall biosynthesis
LFAFKCGVVNTFQVSQILRIISTTKKYGGDIFEDEMEEAFQSAGHKVQEFNPVPQGQGRLHKVPGYLKNLMTISNRAQNSDYVMRAMNHVFFMDQSPKQIVVAYHYDTAYCHPLVKAHHYMTLRSLIGNKDKISKLVVISKYWRDYFHELGFQNIETIYCGFDKNEFVADSKIVESLQTKINPGDKKIVYIGNSQKKKGADKAYEILKDRKDILLVTSGNKDVNLPCLNLELNRKEYLAFLSLSDVVVTFSQFKEGWNRVAHEAMMMGVPVIGSGYGGMGELLSGGGQKIIRDCSLLGKSLDEVLKDREIGLRGKEFAQTFTRDRFNKACIDLVI